MKRNIYHSILAILLIFSTLNISNSCSNREEVLNCIPDLQININYLLPNEKNDLAIKSWTYIDRDGAGTRGLIIVKVGGGYTAYDRNAPHICPDVDTSLIVEYPYIKCPKDGAKWDIFGQYIDIANKNLVPYTCSYNPNTGEILIYY